MQSVRVIAGLGNPGPRYDGTRHNIGFSAVERLAARHSAPWKEESRFCAQTASIVIDGNPALLLKPQTFMNASGKAVAAVCRYYKWAPVNVLVVYDEVQLPPGTFKLNTTGGAGGHNGLADIIQLLGRNFPRLRLGIGEKHHPEMSLTDYVLGRFSADEISRLAPRWDAILDAMELILRKGPLLAGNTLNQRKRQHERPNETDLPTDRHS
ncbi:MAG: aminoacyl-tRNA hydrolase [Verrucomicrobia bacterium]|jgi:PTH1 family peptidyl-tRNA hydrolase|nr:aminoacyl-tRNA hydrolase [Verrucomicrobiota bacterium]